LKSRLYVSPDLESDDREAQQEALSAMAHNGSLKLLAGEVKAGYQTRQGSSKDADNASTAFSFPSIAKLPVPSHLLSLRASNATLE
jgi:hypothetical protein